MHFHHSLWMFSYHSPLIERIKHIFHLHFAKILYASWHFHPAFFIQDPQIHLEWYGHKPSYCCFLRYVKKAHYNATQPAMLSANPLHVSGLTALSSSHCGMKYFKSDPLQQNLLSAWAHKYSAHASLSVWHIPFLLVWTLNVKKPSERVTWRKPCISW